MSESDKNSIKLEHQQPQPQPQNPHASPSEQQHQSEQKKQPKLQYQHYPISSSAHQYPANTVANSGVHEPEAKIQPEVQTKLDNLQVKYQQMNQELQQKQGDPEQEQQNQLQNQNFIQNQNDNQNDDNEQIDEEQEQQLSPNNPDYGSQQLLQQQKKRSHKKLDISNFIMKTYKILQDKRNSNIVEWTDQGNCFIVKDKDKFSKQILPKYFKHNKFSSFVRQLNMYDFHKIRKEKQIPIFKHKYFQEGRLDLLHKIKRKAGQDGKQDELPSRQLINLSQPNINIGNNISISNISSNVNLGQNNNYSNSYNQVESRQQLSHNNIKATSIQSIPSTKTQIQMLKKENAQLQQSINDIAQDIQLLQMNKEKKKEKLVKIITSIMFFDLNANISYFTSPSRITQSQEIISNGSSSDAYNFVQSLRTLQDHFVKDQDPLSFSEYRRKLSLIYGSLKANLLM